MKAALRADRYRQLAQDYCDQLSRNLADKPLWDKLTALLEEIHTAAPDAKDLWIAPHALFKEQVWRDIRAFWRMGVRNLPYVMYGPIPNQQPSLVDGLGMRLSLKDDAPVVYEDFLKTPLRRGLVIGNSTAAGVGVSDHAETLSSVLNRMMPDTVWFNLAIGGHNLTQNAITLDLFGPDRFDYLVICAGLIDFLVTLTLQPETPHIPPYLLPHQPPELPTTYDIEANGWSLSGLARHHRRALETIAARASRSNARTLFLLQPHIGMGDKPLSSEERCMEMVYIQTADRPVWKAHTKIAPYRKWISDSLSSACASAGIPFLDSNAHAHFREREWLYLDYIHVNGRGQAHMADIVAAWIKQA